MATKKKADKPAIDPERAAQIRSDALSGTNWASQVQYGPACVCGAFKEGATVTSNGWVMPKGGCYRHGVIQPSRVAR